MSLRDWYRIPAAGSVRLVRVYAGEPTQAEPRWLRPGISRTAFEFVRVFDRHVLDALELLLRKPDPTCLPRGSIMKYAGADDRFRKWLPLRVRAIRSRELANLGLSEEEIVL